MQFYRKKARTMGVPIVPMIDILTILLIFFIVHTQWKKPQSLLKIDVPGAEFMEGRWKRKIARSWMPRQHSVQTLRM